MAFVDGVAMNPMSPTERMAELSRLLKLFGNPTLRGADTETDEDIENLADGVPDVIEDFPELVWVFWIPSKKNYSSLHSKYTSKYLMLAKTEGELPTETANGIPVEHRRATPNDAIDLAKAFDFQGIAFCDSEKIVKEILF